MSVAIVVRDKSTIVVAADSMWLRQGVEVCSSPKSKIRRDDALGLIVAFAGDGGYEDLLKGVLVQAIEKYGDEWPEQWSTMCLMSDISENMLQLCQIADVAALVVWQGRVFQLSASGSIFESGEPFIAIGCGADYALGAAHVLMDCYSEQRNVFDIASLAVSTACTLTAFCGPPIETQIVNLGGTG